MAQTIDLVMRLHFVGIHSWSGVAIKWRLSLTTCLIEFLTIEAVKHDLYLPFYCIMVQKVVSRFAIRPTLGVISTGAAKMNPVSSQFVKLQQFVWFSWSRDFVISVPTPAGPTGTQYLQKVLIRRYRSLHKPPLGDATFWMQVLANGVITKQKT